MLQQSSRIFLAGHNGLVGNAIFQKLKKKKFKNILVADRKKLDLQDFNKVDSFFKNKKIDFIIMAAAKAGGILANNKYKKEFFYSNIEIQNNLLKIAIKKKVKRVIFLGTSCIYPKFARNPIKEKYLLTGPLEKTNQSYSIAKIAGIKLCEALFEEENLDVACLMPTNIYGRNDNFDEFSGHVIPSMISKIIRAKRNRKKRLYLLGTGKPIREFLHADDLADAIFLILKKSKKQILNACENKFPIINIGSGESVTIKKLSDIIKKSVKYKNKILFDKKSPDGTFKKNLDSSRIRKLGWKPKISLVYGLKNIVELRLKS